MVDTCCPPWLRSSRWKPSAEMGRRCFGARPKNGERDSFLEIWARVQNASRPRQTTQRSCFSSYWQATKNDRCPVKIYREFARHRPVEMNQPDSPFYFAVKHQRKPGDKVWYMLSALGKKKRDWQISFHDREKCRHTRQSHQLLGT